VQGKGKVQGREKTVSWPKGPCHVRKEFASIVSKGLGEECLCHGRAAQKNRKFRGGGHKLVMITEKKSSEEENTGRQAEAATA